MLVVAVGATLGYVLHHFLGELGPVVGDLQGIAPPQVLHQAIGAKGVLQDPEFTFALWCGLAPQRVWFVVCVPVFVAVLFALCRMKRAHAWLIFVGICLTLMVGRSRIERRILANTRIIYNQQVR